MKRSRGAAGFYGSRGAAGFKAVTKVFSSCQPLYHPAGF
jgi:hypothetical protein